MANKRISEMPLKTVLSTSDFLPIVDTSSGLNNYTSKRTTVGSLVAFVGDTLAGAEGFVTAVNGETGSSITIDLADLPDVELTAPVSGEVLSYDGLSNKWVNFSLAAYYAPLVAGKVPASYLPADALNATTAQFTVKAVSQGAYTDGNVIPAGTSLEAIIRNMLQARIPAVYVQPALSISTPAALTHEYGASIAISVNLAWTQNDAGPATMFRYRKNGAVMQTNSGSSPATFSHSFVLNAPTTFTGEAEYNQGPQKYDNMGDASGTPIPMGTTASANSVVFVPRHKRYWGLSTAANITDAELITLNSELATTRVQTRNDFVPANQYIYIAYPASFGLATIKFNGYIATSAWPLTARNVVNASGYSEPYYIYRTQYTHNSPDIDIEVL